MHVRVDQLSSFHLVIHPSYTNFIAARAGLPTYKCSAIIRNHHERNLLDAKECPDCKSVSTYFV